MNQHTIAAVEPMSWAEPVAGVRRNHGAVARMEQLLQAHTTELLEFLQQHPWDDFDFDQLQLLKTRFGYFKKVTERIDRALAEEPGELARLRAWFRQESEPCFVKSGLMTRARSWPGGYPGDFETLEAIYANVPWVERGLGNYLDRYFLSSTLAEAVRWRLRKLVSLLHHYSHLQADGANWLNVASGSCRELEKVAGKRNRTIWCLDSDPRSLAFAQRWLQKERYSGGERVEFVCQDAGRLVRAERNRRQFGELTLCYSAGLFDYVKTASLSRILRGIYDSLARGGVLIGTFKDAERYDTFDYHWLVAWHFFLQRTLEQCYEIFDAAEIPRDEIRVERDATGVILFFIVTKK
jgi:SAM-dependent methyltransferase